MSQLNIKEQNNLIRLGINTLASDLVKTLDAMKEMSDDWTIEEVRHQILSQASRLDTTISQYESTVLNLKN